MPDTSVEDAFARFSQEHSGTFRPVPVEAMPTWRRARRRGVLWLGGLGAAVVAALSLNALQPATAPERPLITDRVVRLEGARGTMVVQFVDRDRGWVLFSDCTPGVGCDRFLGRTADAGRTWTPVALPEELPHPGTASFVIRGAESFFVGTSDPLIAWWQTDDAGRTYRELDLRDAVQQGYAPDRIVAPTSRGPWRLTSANLETIVAYSPDAGRTWRDLEPKIGTGAVLRVAPGDGEAWAIAGQPTRAWRLTPGGAVPEPGLPVTADAATISPVGDGGLIMLLPGMGVGIWRAGRFTPLPEPLAEATLVGPLADGAIAMLTPDGDVIIGSGPEQWVRYIRP